MGPTSKGMQGKREMGRRREGRGEEERKRGEGCITIS